MKRLTGILFLVLVIVTLSCDKEETSPFGLNCENLKNGIINSNQDLIGTEISKVIQDLVPVPTASDIIGHSSNFEILIKRLSPCDETSAQVICYCCSFTNPSRTEVVITTYLNRKSYVQVIEIFTPRDNSLSYKGIQDPI